jgi:ubiquinone/menaquinone biosynthesis C-methylase UbiE
MNDKYIEIRRYDQRALQILNCKTTSKKKIKDYINVPYQYYFSLLKKLKKTKLLEIGAGTGENTLKLIKMKFNVCATDISPKSVEVMSQKYSKYKNFSSKVVDMEKLPFKNESFDVICSAGSLSYGDNNLVMNEIYRVLKLGGGVVLVNSLNDNPIYRFNRYINYIKGNRTESTLKRMLNVNLIDKYINKFGYGKVKFFGSITWAFPLLKVVLEEV